MLNLHEFQRKTIRTVWKTTFIVSNSKFARTKPIYHFAGLLIVISSVVLLKIDLEVDVAVVAC